MKYLVPLLALVLVACAPSPDTTNPSTDMNRGEAHGDAPLNRDFDAMPRSDRPVTTERVAYFGDTEGFLAEPDEPAAPGVILIHEWWGLNANMEETARRLASHGYRVLAVDLYDGKVATTPDEARALRVAVEQGRAIANLKAADAFLRTRGSVKTASWGYCFGGGHSATFALEGVTDATVVYYGSLADPLAEPERVNAPMLLVFGSEDAVTTLASAQELEIALRGIDKDVTLYAYEGRGHAFANPSNPGHDVNDTRDAWRRTLAFLNEKLR
jgi:carboxymethylenebutenolidase